METDTKEIRCVNIDWLEVYCLEPVDEPRSADWFRDNGFTVKERAYGTPQYRQMFTIVDEGRAVVEMRRDPLSLKEKGGVFEKGSCHVRLTNYACYLSHPIHYLAEFIFAAGLVYRSLTRIDICLDFQRFDSGLIPTDFVASFMQGHIMKINQCNLAAHGKDGWKLREWNSLKWGAETSLVTTKLYNKSLELGQVKDKSYIRHIWEACGFNLSQDVWRVEFAIKSGMNMLCSDSDAVLIPRHLTSFDTKDKLFFQFCVFAHKYFHFKNKEYTRSGALRPKNRCTDVDLFRFTGKAQFYEPTHLVVDESPGRTEKLLARRLFEMSLDKSIDTKVRRSCEDISIHFAQRYIVLDYVTRLEQLLEFNAARHPDYASDMAMLEHVRRKYQVETVRPKTVRKKVNYLLIE